MKDKSPLKLRTYQHMIEFARIGHEAARHAREENRKLGIANVYSKAGRLYWELPNGEIAFENPHKEGGALAAKSGARQAVK